MTTSISANERTHTIVVNGQKHIWIVKNLWKKAEDLKEFEFQVSEYDGLDMDCWYCGVNPPTVKSVIEHARRFEDADLSYPIILSETGIVMDGKHRICKAILKGIASIKCVQFDKTPDPDEIVSL